MNGTEKRGPGRPRKHFPDASEEKRGRGRPRKYDGHGTGAQDGRFDGGFDGVVAVR